MNAPSRWQCDVPVIDGTTRCANEARYVIVRDPQVGDHGERNICDEHLPSQVSNLTYGGLAAVIVQRLPGQETT